MNVGTGGGSSPVYYAGPGGSPTLNFDRSSWQEPLGWEQLRDGPRANWIKSSAEVQGHRALVLIGAIYHVGVVVTWHATPDTNLIVQASGLPETQVLEIARHLTYHGPSIVTLPLTAAHAISRAAAIRAARPTTGGVIGAKLTSLTEIQQLRYRIPPKNWQPGAQSTSLRTLPRRGQPGKPTPLQLAPWRPVWAILLSKPADELVLVDAQDGHVLERSSVSANERWFSAITDRDPAIGGCPGGSTVRLPFGILTRSEEEAPYIAREQQQQSNGGAGSVPGGVSRTYFVLASVATLDHRNLEGCTAACLRKRLVWVAMTVTTGRPGSPVYCPMAFGGPFASHRKHRRPPPVGAVYEFGYGSGAGVTCGKAPSWWTSLHDLAPPTSGDGALHFAGVNVPIM